MLYSIYLIENKVNSLVYVGCTCMPIAHRWYQHMHTRNSRLARDIRQLGRDAFAVKLLQVSDNRLDATQAERKWIADLRANHPTHGYNSPARAN